MKSPGLVATMVASVFAVLALVGAGMAKSDVVGGNIAAGSGYSLSTPEPRDHGVAPRILLTDSSDDGSGMGLVPLYHDPAPPKALGRPLPLTPEGLSDKAEELTNTALLYIQNAQKALNECDYEAYEANRQKLWDLQQIAYYVRHVAERRRAFYSARGPEYKVWVDGYKKATADAARAYEDIASSRQRVPDLPEHCRVQPEEEEELPPPEPQAEPGSPEPPTTEPPAPAPAPPAAEPEMPKPPVAEPGSLPEPPAIPPLPSRPSAGATASGLPDVPANCCNTAESEAQLAQCETVMNEAWDQYSQIREQIARMRKTRSFADADEEMAVLGPLEAEEAHWLKVAGAAKDRCEELRSCMAAAKTSAACEWEVEFIVVAPPIHFSSGDTMACQLIDRRLPADCCDQEKAEARLEQCEQFVESLDKKFNKTRVRVELGRSIGAATQTDEEALLCDLRMVETARDRCETIKRCIRDAKTSPICSKPEKETEAPAPVVGADDEPTFIRSTDPDTGITTEVVGHSDGSRTITRTDGEGRVLSQETLPPPVSGGADASGAAQPGQ